MFNRPTGFRINRHSVVGTIHSLLYTQRRWIFDQIYIYKIRRRRRRQRVFNVSESRYNYNLFFVFIVFTRNTKQSRKSVQTLVKSVYRCQFGIISDVSIASICPITRCSHWRGFVGDKNRTDKSTRDVGRQKLLTATCRADKSALIVAAFSMSLFTPLYRHVGRRFLCRSTWHRQKFSSVRFCHRQIGECEQRAIRSLL